MNNNEITTEKSPTIALFPGQGSQSVGMGKELLSFSSLASEHFQIANEALGFDLSKICFEGPLEKLTETSIAQPAILTVSIIFYRLAESEGMELPKCGLGHSLGEYSALVAAESLDFTDAVKLVNKRGLYMQEAVPQGIGKMVAVLGVDVEEVNNACKEATETTEGICEVANINSNGQVVVSGNIEAVDRCQKILSGKKLRELTVSAPFHCSLMKPAAEKLSQDLKDINIKTPKFPVYSNARAVAQTSPEQIRESLVEQVSKTVRFTECVDNAVDNFKVQSGTEFGNGRVLAGLIKRINKQLKISSFSPSAILAQKP